MTLGKTELKARHNLGGFRITIMRFDRKSRRAESCVLGAKCKHISKALYSARLKGGFLSIVKVEALTAEQFEKEFPGRGKRKTSASKR